MRMEALCQKSHSALRLTTLLSFLCFCHALSPPGTIQLYKTQQLLLTSLDPTSPSSQPFLTSPSGICAAYLVRSQTDSGNSFCYIQVQGLGGGSPSPINTIGCVPISGSHTCSLVFSSTGLGIFEGRNPTWTASVPSGDHSKALILLDSGELEMSDHSGRIAWTASQNLVADQNCGSSSSPDIFSPFASPSEDVSSGQVLDQNGQQQQQQEQPQFGNPYQDQQGLGNYPQQQQGRNRGFSGFNQRPFPNGFNQQPFSNGFSQPFGAGDQQGYTGDGSFESGAPGRGLEVLGMVLGLLVSLIALS